MDHDKTGKELYSTTVIPNRGAWLEYETDVNDVLCSYRQEQKVGDFIYQSVGLGTDAEISIFRRRRENKATIEKDQATNVEEGLIEVYKTVRQSLRQLTAQELTSTICL